MAVKMLNTKVIHRSIMNHILLNHFSEKQLWKTLFHFQFGLLFLTFVVCFDKMVRGRRSLAPDDELVNKTNVKKKFKLKVE